MVKTKIVIKLLISILLLGGMVDIVSAAGSISIKLFGYVEDFNGVRLPNAFVGVSSERHGYLGGATCNSEGYYEFFVNEPGNYWLGAQHNSVVDTNMYDYTIDRKQIITHFDFHPRLTEWTACVVVPRCTFVDFGDAIGAVV